MAVDLQALLATMTLEDIQRELEERAQVRRATLRFASKADAVPQADRLLRAFDTKQILGALAADVRVLFVSIYDRDNQREVRELTAPGQVRAAAATAAMFLAGQIQDLSYGRVRLQTENYGLANNVCPGERFVEQECGASGTAVLVGPRVIATSAHLLQKYGDLRDLRFVFGFRVGCDGGSATELPASEVYRAVGIVGINYDPDRDIDWMVLKLDRDVEGHAPVRIRRGGRPAAGQAVYAVGHPRGLPAKVADDARVHARGSDACFHADIDSQTHSSGSPVYNAATDVVEGILRGGGLGDWDPKSTICRRSFVVSSVDSPWKFCVRTTLFAHLIPELGF